MYFQDIPYMYNWKYKNEPICSQFPKYFLFQKMQLTAKSLKNATNASTMELFSQYIVQG